MKQVRWSALARRDLADIDDYYRPRNAMAADRLGKEIIAAAEILLERPLLGPVALDGVRRKWRVAGTSYSLLYAPRADHVRILRVLHSAQDQRRH